jgi:hypothetical protein
MPECADSRGCIAALGHNQISCSAPESETLTRFEHGPAARAVEPIVQCGPGGEGDRKGPVEARFVVYRQVVDTAPSAAKADARSSDSQVSKPLASCTGWKIVTAVVEAMTAA